MKVLKDETQPYFAEVEKLQIIRKEINVGEVTAEKMKELILVVMTNILLF